MRTNTEEKKAARDRLAGILNPIYNRHWERNGRQPDKPVVFFTEAGPSVNYVFKLNTNKAAWTDEQHEELVTMLGPERAAECVETVHEFYLDRKVRAEPGVVDALRVAIAQADLTPDQRSSLLKCKTTRRLRSQVISNLVDYVGQSAAAIARALAIFGTSISRYPQA